MEADYRVVAAILTNQMRKLYGQSVENDANAKSCEIKESSEEKKRGPTEIWTRIAGFRVQSANRYTIRPCSPHHNTNLQRIFYSRNKFTISNERFFSDIFSNVLLATQLNLKFT